MEDSFAHIALGTFTNIHCNALYMYESYLNLMDNEIYDIGSKIPFYENNTYNG